MKRNRIILIILWIMSVIAISFYGGVISYGFFIIFTSIPVIALAYILFVILFFKVYQKLDGRHLVSNRTFTFYFTLQNESLIPFSGIRVSFYSSFSKISGLDDATEYELAPHTGIRKNTELVCRYRGEYEVGIRKIIVQDFFRLFRIAYKNKEPLRVTVKPDIVTLDSLRVSDEIMSSAKDSRAELTEPDVLVREYLPTDDKRMINWKATAAAQKLMVRERTGQQQPGVGIIMDPKRISDVQKEYLPVENKMLETVIAMALYFCSHNIPVSVHDGSRTYDDRTGSYGFFDTLYENLCAFSFDEESDNLSVYNNALREESITDKKTVFIITHTWDANTGEFARELSRRGIFVRIYIVNDEESSVMSDDEIPRCSIVTIPTDADLKEVL